MKKIYIASDHAGIELKKRIQEHFSKVAEWNDLGPQAGQRVDYPDYAKKLCEAMKVDSQSFGILICGSGIGMSISANRHTWIRAALVENPVAAKLSREHNDSNVLCLGARFLAPEYTIDIVEAWLSTPFSNDSRHQARIAKLS